MKGTDEDEMLTMSEAAQVRGVTYEAIRSLVRRGKLRSAHKYGRLLVYRSEVLNFKKEKPGRKTDGKSQA